MGKSCSKCCCVCCPFSRKKKSFQERNEIDGRQPGSGEEKHHMQTLLHDDVNKRDACRSKSPECRETEVKKLRKSRKRRPEKERPGDIRTKTGEENKKDILQQQREILEKEQLDFKANCENQISELKQEWAKETEKLESRIKYLEHVKPYANATAEVESLIAVLDMKNEEIHKFQAKVAKCSMQQEEITSLNKKIEQLLRKNEDLTVFLREKVDEIRKLEIENNKLHRLIEDEHKRSERLQRHNEELIYQIHCSSPSSSPFNPVFAPSPTVSSSSLNTSPKHVSSSTHVSNKANGNFPATFPYSDKDTVMT